MTEQIQKVEFIKAHLVYVDSFIIRREIVHINDLQIKKYYVTHIKCIKNSQGFINIPGTKYFIRKKKNLKKYIL